jgi:hypothetical protein
MRVFCIRSNSFSFAGAVAGCWNLCIDNSLPNRSIKKNLNDQIMSTFTEMRKVVTAHHLISGSKPFDDHYRLDRSETYQYFTIHKEWSTKLRDYFAKLRLNNERVVHIDICGRSGARSMGADISYCFSLYTSDFAKKIAAPEKILFDGDILTTKDFNSFVSLVNKDAAPALITFEPVAGLQAYSPGLHQDKVSFLYKDITYQQLIRRLRVGIELLRPGGFIYLERPFQFDSGHFVDIFNNKKFKDFAISIAIKNIVKKYKCKIEIRGHIGGPYFLIQKPL